MPSFRSRRAICEEMEPARLATIRRPPPLLAWRPVPSGGAGMKGRMARWPSPSPSPTAWRFRDRSRLLPWTALLPSSPSLRIVISGSPAGLGSLQERSTVGLSHAVSAVRCTLPFPAGQRVFRYCRGLWPPDRELWICRGFGGSLVPPGPHSHRFRQGEAALRI